METVQSKFGNEIYVRNPDVSVRLFNSNQAIVYNPNNLHTQHLNQTGLMIWRILKVPATLGKIVSELLELVECPSVEAMATDVQDFIRELMAHEMIEQGAAHSKTMSGIPDSYIDWADAPLEFDFSLTRYCNLACEYCFYAHEMQNRDDLKLDEWLRFIRELGSLAVRKVTLSGGEVFLRKDLWEIIDALVENRMRYSILSNGTLLTDAVLRKFDVNRRRERLNYIQVSIDGSCPEIHDKSRGKGSFEKAIAGLKRLKAAGFPVSTRVTVNRYNVDDLENTAHLLLDEIGLDEISTNEAIGLGSGCDNRTSIALRDDQIVQSMRILSRLNDKYDHRILATAGPLAKWRMFQEMDYSRESGKKLNPERMGFLSACGCMFNKLAVHHDGIISPCNMLPGAQLGRINQDPITEIWKNNPILQQMRTRRSIRMQDVPECSDCEFADYCTGSCPGVPYEQTGDMNRANMEDCYKRFLEISGGIRPWRE